MSRFRHALALWAVAVPAALLAVILLRVGGKLRALATRISGAADPPALPLAPSDAEIVAILDGRLKKEYRETCEELELCQRELELTRDACASLAGEKAGREMARAFDSISRGPPPETHHRNCVCGDCWDVVRVDGSPGPKAPR